MTSANTTSYLSSLSNLCLSSTKYPSGKLYAIYLVAMKQTNVNTGFSRDIKIINSCPTDDQEDVESDEEDELVTFSRPVKVEVINQRRKLDKIVKMVPFVTVDLEKLTSQYLLEDECNLVLKLPRAAAAQSDRINSLSKKLVVRHKMQSRDSELVWKVCPCQSYVIGRVDNPSMYGPFLTQLCKMAEDDPLFVDHLYSIAEKGFSTKGDFVEYLFNNGRRFTRVLPLPSEGVDVLVNNAGTAGGSLFEEYENAAEYKRIDIDFWGHVNTTHFALEHLQRRRGQIVVISSMIAFLPFPFTTVYSAAKGALLNFFETLRIELISKSVTVTIASPGFIQSELTSREWPGKLPWWFPMARTEDAAREIVEAALRKERDVITPRWYSSLLWFRILCPEILEWVPRVFILGQAPTRGVEIVCNSVFGKFNTHTLFKTLKLA